MLEESGTEEPLDKSLGESIEEDLVDSDSVDNDLADSNRADNKSAVVELVGEYLTVHSANAYSLVEPGSVVWLDLDCSY